MATTCYALLGVALVACATAAPISFLEVEESALQPSEKDMVRTMKEGLKVWEEGERADGSESLKKLDSALTKEIDGGMAKAEHKAEVEVEESAIRNHAEHPRQMAKDEAKLIMRGVKSSEALVGDDLSIFSDGLKGAEDAAKAKGGGMTPGFGKQTEKDLQTGFGLYQEGKRIRQAMETYVPSSAESLLQLEPDAEVIKNSRQDRASLGHPKMAAKYVAMIEGDAAPAPVSVQGTSLQKDGNGDDTQAGRGDKAPGEPKPVKKTARTTGGHYSPQTPKKVDAAKYIDKVMAKVGPIVDMQFAPLEEQLGYNLHQEVKIAKHEADAERSRSARDKTVPDQQKDMREANAIDVAAKDAEEEAQVMKAAVNKAKQEHAGMGGEEVLLQMEEGNSATLKPSPLKALRPVVQRTAIQIMLHNNKLDGVVEKAMRKAERTFNTEIAPEMPQAMKGKKGATDIIDRQLKAPSISVADETRLMASLHAPPGEPSFPGALIQIEAGPSYEPPKDFNVEDQAPTGFLKSAAAATAREHMRQSIAKAVPQAMASQQLFDQLRNAAIARVEKDDHDAFAGLKLKGMTHSYKAETKLQNQLTAEGNEVERKRIQVSQNVANGVLPNGKHAHLSKFAHIVPIDP